MLRSMMQFAESADFSRGLRGGTAMYLPYNDEYGVLYSKLFTENKISPDNFKATIHDVWEQYLQGHKVAPIVGYARGKDGKGIHNPYHKGSKYRDLVFVHRAPGKRLNDIIGYKKPTCKTEERLNGPEEHYDDIIRTFVSILNSRIRPDISAKNTIHHPVAGFNFVDFNQYETQKQYGHVENHTADFLKSFLLLETGGSSNPKKYFLTEYLRQEYLNVAIREQKLLINKLYKNGIAEQCLDYAVGKIEELGIATVDELFGK